MVIITSMVSAHENWAIVQTKVNREAEVKRLLCEAGLAMYLPLIKRKIVRFGKKGVHNVPMFPGYVFVRGVTDSSFNLVRYCRGVLRILGGRNGIWLLEDGYIQEIASREVDGVVALIKMAEDVFAGDPVVVTEGPFEGWKGIFQEHLADGERVRIMLTHVRFSNLMVIPKAFVSTGNGMAIK